MAEAKQAPAQATQTESNVPKIPEGPYRFTLTEDSNNAASLINRRIVYEISHGEPSKAPLYVNIYYPQVAAAITSEAQADIDLRGLSSAEVTGSGNTAAAQELKQRIAAHTGMALNIADEFQSYVVRAMNAAASGKALVTGSSQPSDDSPFKFGIETQNWVNNETKAVVKERWMKLFVQYGNAYVQLGNVYASDATAFPPATTRWIVQQVQAAYERLMPTYQAKHAPAVPAGRADAKASAPGVEGGPA